MKLRFELEVSPKEAAEFLQQVAEQTGTHKEGPNSRVSVGETVAAVIKRATGETEHVGSESTVS